MMDRLLNFDWENLFVLTNILIFIALLFVLSRTNRTSWSLSKKVFLGLCIGLLFGLALHVIYDALDHHQVLQQSVNWFNIVGNGYIRLLQMIVMPLILVSILGAVAKLHNATSLGKISVLTIGTLLLTTLIAGLIGVLVTYLFNLSAHGLVFSEGDLNQLSSNSHERLEQVSNLSVPEMLISFIPKNPFNALADLKTTAIMSVVLFAVFLGMATLRLVREDAEKGKLVLTAIEALQALVMKMVKLVMGLTPYGVMALMTKMVVTSNPADILRLGSFIVASYVGLGLMLIIQGIFVGLTGLNPWRFFQKIWPVITFAFTSRSSAAAIPLNVETQTRRLGVPESIASFAASFGATIGQNGCAGLYPAMLAVMVAPTVGINPFEPLWILTLVGMVTISSVGVAGVGGGAIFAALIVLPAMGLPVGLVALLISIEPLIDMGRTALNVSGSITAGAVTSQLLGQTDKAIFNAKEHGNLSASETSTEVRQS